MWNKKLLVILSLSKFAVFFKKQHKATHQNIKLFPE